MNATNNFLNELGNINRPEHLQYMGWAKLTDVNTIVEGAGDDPAIVMNGYVKLNLADPYPDNYNKTFTYDVHVVFSDQIGINFNGTELLINVVDYKINLSKGGEVKYSDFSNMVIIKPVITIDIQEKTINVQL